MSALPPEEAPFLERAPCGREGNLAARWGDGPREELSKAGLGPLGKVQFPTSLLIRGSRTLLAALWCT